MSCSPLAKDALNRKLSLTLDGDFTLYKSDNIPTNTTRISQEDVEMIKNMAVARLDFSKLKAFNSVEDRAPVKLSPRRKSNFT